MTDILVLIALLIALVLLYAASRPSSFRIERSTVIKAPPDRVFALLDDYKAWGQWSPWEKKDPGMARTYSGAASGKGARYAWEGNKNVGKGSMEILESTPPSRLALRLDFTKPFEAHNLVDFTLAREGDGTRVTWVMHGPQPFMSKLMTMFISLDKMVGGDFETGLANLKAAAERHDDGRSA